MSRRETGGTPREVLTTRPKGEVIDFQGKRKNERGDRPYNGKKHEQPSAVVLDTPEQRQLESLTEQLRFLAKRLDIAIDTLSDSSAVKQIDKNYKDLMNEMQKTVVKYDSAIKPLRSDIKNVGRTVDNMQKKYDRSSGAVKFMRSLFPALDSASRELGAMRTDLETKEKKIATQEKKRLRASGAAKEYNDLINALHQAEGLVAEITALTPKEQ